MYNGIGLTTPRGSGTNGHVQRNWAFVRPGKKENSNYRSEEDIKKLDATLNRPPNKDILDHDRKRKIEVKCLEFEEILEKQGLSTDEIKAKVDSYRQKLMGQGKTDLPKDEFGRIAVRDTHQIAEAQQEKNAKLREAFNISEYFVEGSSFDSDRKAKEDLAKSLALQKELDAQREQAAAASANERESSKRYALVRTPSMERNVSLGDVGGNGDNDDHTNKKKKKKMMRESSASPARKKDKKKKSKKRKKDSKSKKSKKLRKRKSSDSESNAENGKDSANEDTDSDSEVDVKKSRKKSKKDKKKREKKNKKKERSSSSDKSRSTSPINKHSETKKSETLTGKKSSGNPFRSRSKEKSNKSKESQRRHYESSQESRNRRSRSRNNKDLIKCRSRSSGDKDLCNRHTRIENDSRNVGRRDDKRDYYQKHKSSSSDNRSRECNERDDNNRDIDRDRENRRSRSRQRSRRIDTAERLRDLKRKYSEEHLHRKRDSPSVDKRKKYSCSPPQSRSRHSRDNKSYARTTQIISTPSRTRSRTPRHKSSDRQQFQRVNTSRSRSIKENMRNKSLTPTPRITELMETNESKKTDTNNINNQEKDVSNSVSSSQKDAKHTGRKSRSRNTSSSSSHSASSTDSESSRSRTPSPKKEILETASAAKNIDTVKLSSRKTKSPSLKRTPSPANKRSKSRNVLIEQSTEDKQRPVSISRESQEKSNEKREEYTQLTSKTPPPSRVEKKALSPRSSRDSSELSYSPARRNPERYRDILENTKNQKTEKRKPVDKDEGRKEPTKSSKQSEERERDRKEKGGKCDKNLAKPVVRLQSQSEDESDATERNAEKMLDEFQESKRERELKDLKMLEQLKTGIAAKAKEKIKTIEKMAACSSTSSSSNTGAEPLVAALADSSLVDAIVSKVSTATVAAAESAARRGRSRSRRSRSRNRREDKPSNGGGSNNGGGGGEREGNRRRSTSHSRSSRSSSSSRSRSRSHSRRSSRSHSSHSSSSSRSSSRSSSSSSFGSSRSGTRSPSIPRRRGSPSFLDRRRITSRYSASRDRRH